MTAARWISAVCNHWILNAATQLARNFEVPLPHLQKGTWIKIKTQKEYLIKLKSRYSRKFLLFRPTPISIYLCLHGCETDAVRPVMSPLATRRSPVDHQVPSMPSITSF